MFKALRLLPIFTLALLSAFARAQQQAPALAGIAHVALRVHDLAASVAFYQSLGYVQAFDLRRDNVPYESFIKIDDRQFIELYPTDAKNPNPAFLHLCFEGDDLEAIHADYISHGLTPKEVRKAGAGNMLFTMPGPMQPIGPGGDPVAQNIEYTQYLEGSLHSKDFGQHLGSDRIADKLIGVSLAVSDLEAARMFYINQLSFKPLPGNQMVMHLPGNSGEEVELVPAIPLGTHARIMLQSDSLGRSGRRLSKEHIKFEKKTETLTFSDPDGNEIVIRQH